MHRISRVVLTLTAVAALASVSVSAAEAAGHGRSRGYASVRYRGGYGGYSRGYATRGYARAYSRGYYGGYSPRVVVARPVRYYRPAYGVYHVGPPVSGGFLAFGGGGVSLGFTLASRPYGYYYMDPYCNTRFSSLAAYHNHCVSHHHEVVVRVIHENAPPSGGYSDDRGYSKEPEYREDWNGGEDNDKNWNDGDDTYDDRPGWNDKEERHDWNEGDDEDDDGGGR